MQGDPAMELKLIGQDFSVCKVEDYSQVDLEQEYCFLAKTDEERSLVCPSSCVPGNVLVRDDGWRAFRIQGILDFSLIGILAGIATLLAEAKISIFAVSDYVLIKSEHFDRALQVLSGAGYQIIPA